MSAAVHPSFGVCPREAIEAALKAPAGGAVYAIREFVPNFSLKKSEHPIWDVTLTVEASIRVRVSAPDQRAAEDLACEHYDVDEIVSGADIDADARSARDQFSLPDIEWEDESEDA